MLLSLLFLPVVNASSFSLRLASSLTSFFLAHFVIFVYFVFLLLMGKFKSMVDALERLDEFKRRYNILDDVEMSYSSKFMAILSKGEGRVVIPLVNFVEGEVRIPMSDLLTNFLRHFKIFLDQCTPNVFRIVSYIDTLNKKLGLKLTSITSTISIAFKTIKPSGITLKFGTGR